jgi:hypothetical protein
LKLRKVDKVSGTVLPKYEAYFSCQVKRGRDCKVGLDHKKPKVCNTYVIRYVGCRWPGYKNILGKQKEDSEPITIGIYNGLVVGMAYQERWLKRVLEEPHIALKDSAQEVMHDVRNFLAHSSNIQRELGKAIENLTNNITRIAKTLEAIQSSVTQMVDSENIKET